VAAKPETKDIKAEEQKPKVPSPMGWGLGEEQKPKVPSPRPSVGWGLGRPSVRTLKTLIPEPTQSQPQLHFLAPTPTPEPTRT